MSALQDVQRSLNTIRELSVDENTQVLELKLKASISQLKSIGEEPQSKDKAPRNPTPLPFPKPAKLAAPKLAPRTQSEPRWASRRSKLRVNKPQAPNS